MSSIAIDDVDVAADGRTVTAHVRGDGDTRRFLDTDRLVNRYPHSVSDVPEGVLAIPALANLCPLAWALGVDVHVPEVDRTFADALPAIRRSFDELYENWEFAGDVHAERYADVRHHGGEKSLTLFTGGVDSLATYLGHRAEDPTLATVYFTDDGMAETEKHRTVEGWIRSVADREDAEMVGIHANLRELFDRRAVGRECETFLTDSWWGNVQHGLGLLGAVAPTAYANSVGTVYIAASRTPDTDSAWGSHPEIDGRVRWTGTACSHDGFALTRQEKIDRIAEYSHETGEPLPVRTCWRSDSGLNCGRCEKCCRTILGLELAGLDADDHGFDVPDSFFDVVRSGLQVGEWQFLAGKAAMWRELQECADPERDYAREGMDEFVDWFRDVDVEYLFEKSNEPTVKDHAAVVLRKFPRPVHRTAVRVANLL